MTLKKKDFQKAVSFIQELLLKISEDPECAEVRDSLNLVLVHMQRYYRLLRLRRKDGGKVNLAASMPNGGVSPAVPTHDFLDHFSWRWHNIEHSVPLNGSLPIDGRKDSGIPLVLQAVKEGDKELVAQLIEKDKKCLRQTDSLGRTPLMYAVCHNQHDCLSLLLENKVDLDIQAHDGMTAIAMAANIGNAPAVEQLLQQGANCDLQDIQGRAAVHWAAAGGDTRCLQLLIEGKANPALRDRDGMSPCMWACRADMIDHLDMIQSAPTFDTEEDDGIERDMAGRTWTHWSVRKTEPLQVLQTLLKNHNMAAIVDNEGKSAFLVAAEQGALPACKLMLSELGQDCLDDRDDEKRTCLHLATICGHGEVVNFFLENGANLHATDCHGATAWDYAESRQLHYCMLVLEAHQRQQLQESGQLPPSQHSGHTPQSQAHPPHPPPTPPSRAAKRQKNGSEPHKQQNHCAIEPMEEDDQDSRQGELLQSQLSGQGELVQSMDRMDVGQNNKVADRSRSNSDVNSDQSLSVGMSVSDIDGEGADMEEGQGRAVQSPRGPGNMQQHGPNHVPHPPSRGQPPQPNNQQVMQYYDSYPPQEMYPQEYPPLQVPTGPLAVPHPPPTSPAHHLQPPEPQQRRNPPPAQLAPLGPPLGPLQPVEKQKKKKKKGSKAEKESVPAPLRPNRPASHTMGEGRGPEDHDMPAWEIERPSAPVPPPSPRAAFGSNPPPPKHSKGTYGEKMHRDEHHSPRDGPQEEEKDEGVHLGVPQPGYHGNRHGPVSRKQAAILPPDIQHEGKTGIPSLQRPKTPLRKGLASPPSAPPRLGGRLNRPVAY
ncbi:ankyrin repeat domain-containing protein 35-like [Branchiostoma floridae]|uniref:Ankyrin repeat domain-containing protein 35-like n=1 Tax=Branchiostoma floridae TaxID=7739 RepID=A0A9J7N5T7_BRAFL|nr:ankyrin repeat domain-containing protein 35-like [Branchiostoma floridae]